MLTSFEQRAARYYTDKLLEHGPTPAGVDWNSAESQALRFEQLLKVCCLRETSSLLDFGCGYGALLPYFRAKSPESSYWGYDVAEAMLKTAVELHVGDARARFIGSLAAVPEVDYVVASGLFNVKQNIATSEWEAYIAEMLEKIAGLAKKGFAFNVLTSYSDPARMRSDLYYAQPCFWFDLCKTRFSRNVALLHDYGLFEFTILVRMG